MNKNKNKNKLSCLEKNTTRRWKNTDVGIKVNVNVPVNEESLYQTTYTQNDRVIPSIGRRSLVSITRVVV